MTPTRSEQRNPPRQALAPAGPRQFLRPHTNTGRNTPLSPSPLRPWPRGRRAPSRSPGGPAPTHRPRSHPPLLTPQRCPRWRADPSRLRDCLGRQTGLPGAPGPTRPGRPDPPPFPQQPPSAGQPPYGPLRMRRPRPPALWLAGTNHRPPQEGGGGGLYHLGGGGVRGGTRDPGPAGRGESGPVRRHLAAPPEGSLVRNVFFFT